jgi:hypothetical protein
LNERKPITNRLHKSSSLIECLMFLYSVSSINNQTWFPIVVLTRSISRKAQKNLLLVQHYNLFRLHKHEKLYNNYKIMWEIERKRIKILKAKVKRGIPLIERLRSIEQSLTIMDRGL